MPRTRSGRVAPLIERAASRASGLTLLDFLDGRLDAVADAELDTRIDSWLTSDVAALVVPEPQGVTGHPDHRAGLA